MKTFEMLGKPGLHFSAGDFPDGTYYVAQIKRTWLGPCYVLDHVADYGGFVVAQGPLRPSDTITTSSLIGVWRDKADNDKVYVDRVEIYHDLDVAKHIGRSRGELAIWDLACKEEIRL